MKINVLFFLKDRLDDFFINKNVVVIDILRAASTMITALANGAKSIIPVPTVEEAVKISKNLERSTYLLCGERNTKVIDGFDLGNSPLEYSTEIVAGKKIILTTTNCTKVFEVVKHAQNVLIATSLNVSSVVKKMLETNEEWYVVCSGRDGYYDESDAICAGLLLSKLIENVKNIELNDDGRTSLLVFENAKKNFKKALKNTDHGKILIANGFEKDIDFISKIDTFNLVASLNNNAIVLS